MIIEKAWTKLIGTYPRTAGNWVQNGLRTLIGKPVFSFYT